MPENKFKNRMKKVLQQEENIWRYMSLAKYIDFISNKSIYCCRCDLFNDRTEGEWFAQVVEKANIETHKFFRQNYNAIKKINRKIFSLSKPSLKDIKAAFNTEITEEERENLNFTDSVDQVINDDFFNSIDERLDFLKEIIEESSKQLMVESRMTIKDLIHIKRDIKSLKEKSFISSWFSGDCHSMAMWKSYSQTNEGIAIKTTKEKLRKVKNHNKNIIFNKFKATAICEDVIYVDENTKEVEPLILRHLADKYWIDFRDLLFKHKSYRDEHEFRLIVLTSRNDKEEIRGIKLKIKGNINDFIDEIYLNPLINKNHWFVTVIKKINNLFGVNNNKIKFGQIKTSFSK